MDLRLIPISYLNTYVYCPRRFYLEFVRGMFEDNLHTEDGRSSHETVDARGREARPAKKEDFIHRRSVMWSSERLGITGRLDLLEEDEDSNLYPVEYKKGRKPKGREPWLNDKVQLCAQALLMEENGLPFPARGYLYYISSKARVEVPFEDALRAKAINVIEECRILSRSKDLPEPVNNRNQCIGCSLYPICLPEEEDVIKGRKINARCILPSRLDDEILYVNTIGAYLSLSNNQVVVRAPGGETVGDVSLELLQEVVLCGPVQITTQLLHALLHNQIPVHHLSSRGRYVGVTTSLLHKNGLLREAQWRTHFDPIQSLGIAKNIAEAKLTNTRTLLMRYLRDQKTDEDERIFDQLKRLIQQVEQTTDLDFLRGIEGMGAKIFFEQFQRFMKPSQRDLFTFTGRVRRPPNNPVNALLSFGYSLLAKDCTGAAVRVGLDPYCGYYHSMKYGRPSLALDLMEYFRQPVVDSMVVSSINNAVFSGKDFMTYQNTCYLNERGRKKFLSQYEMRKKDHVTHPMFQYRLSYERTIELQCRILAKYLLGDMEKYVGVRIR
jgi:CRISPR-associated protein Cas1